MASTLLLPACLLIASTAWAAPANLVANPGFEDGATGWQFSVAPGGPGRVLVTTEVPHSGRHALLMDATNSPTEVGAISKPVPVKAGTRYRLGVWVKQTSGYGPYKATIDWRNAAGKHIAYSNDWQGQNLPTSYTIHGGDFHAPTGATQAVLMIGVSAGSAVLMDDFSLTALPPQGPQLRAYLFCEPKDAKGRWRVRAWVRNDGDRPSEPGDVSLSCAPDLRADRPVRRLPSLAPAERVRVDWEVTGVPRSLPAPLRLKMPAGVPVVGDPETTLFAGTSQIVATKGPGVPAPHPVQTKPLVGAYYFPVMLDWDRSGWGVRHVDYLTPLLGYYDEALPEVADWHILWAVNHGISFFAYDWYYNDGSLYLNDALEKGFLRAPHRREMKFCINWCNEGQATWDRPLNFSTKSLCGFMEYLCDHYLGLPEYLRVKGRPVVMIIRPDPIIQAHGGPEGSRKALAAMTEVARRHGLPAPYYMCIGSAARAALYRRAGYDAITAYSYGFADAPRYPNGDCDYDDLVAAHQKIWKTSLAEAKAGGLAYMPVVWTGWDNNARAHDRAVRTRGDTPGPFREMCRVARHYVDPSLNMVIIEAWNEWGEGGYLEPSTERGFGFLDAVRDVFTDLHGPHRDLGPSAAQRASYNATMTWEQIDEMYIRRDRKRRGTGPIVRPDWTFDKDDDLLGWYHMAHVFEPRAAGGSFRGEASTDDPAIFGPVLMEVRASDWSAVKVRLKVDAGADGQLFWAEAGVPKAPTFTEQASVKFPLITDGAWHDYVLPVAKNPLWKGTIEQLRFDPTDAKGAHFAIASIRGVPRR